ncbi:MAG: tetratricopeptide repeat protein, partial [Planctomycetes bacterium]|nr:tetratricopeptide repeat protein [Planctomycetota bacterium]
LPFARAAVAALRSSTTLRALGDVLHLEAVRRNGPPDEDPVPLWEEGLSLDPQDVGARLALGWHHHDRKDFLRVRQLALPGVGRDEQREGELQYLLGLAAMGLQEPRVAQLHFQAARGFRNADDLAALARSLAETRDRPTPTPTPAPIPSGPVGPDGVGPSPPKPTPTPPTNEPRARHRLAAAEIFWRSAQSKKGENKLGTLLNAADTLTRAGAGRDQLTPKELLKLARLLKKVALALSGRRVARQAEALAQVEAAVLLDLSDGSPRRAVERTRALIRGGQGADALRELEALIAGPAARLPLAHIALGEVHVSAKRYDAAAASYHKALAIAPSTSATAKIYLALGATYLRAKQPNKARSTLEAAARLYPDHPKVLLRLSEVYLRLDRSGDAVRTLRAVLKVLPPNHPDRKKAESVLESLVD